MLYLTIHRPEHPDADDFNHGIEAEPAMPPGIICSTPEAADNCGCNRSFVGMSSLKGSTTLMVRDLDLTEADLVTAALGSANAGGWTDTLDGDDEWRADAEAIVAHLTNIASCYPPGTVLRPWYCHRTGEWYFTDYTHYPDGDVGDEATR